MSRLILIIKNSIVHIIFPCLFLWFESNRSNDRTYSFQNIFENRVQCSSRNENSETVNDHVYRPIRKSGIALFLLPF